MKKLMFLTPELPWPARSGGKLKSLKLLQALSKEYQVTLVSPLKQDDAKHLAEFKLICPTINHAYQRVDVARSAKNLLKSYMTGDTLNVYRTFSKALAERVEAMSGKFDVIFIDHYEVFKYVPDTYQGVRVYHAHNTYHQIWSRYAEITCKPWNKLAAYMESVRVRDYELKVAKSADLVFAAPNDLEILENHGIPTSKLKVTYHLGEERHLASPDINFDHTREKLLYIGFLGWEPNSQGILWFLDHVWPVLKSNHPALEMDIVGKGADEKLEEAVASTNGVRLCGFVDDLETVYQSSRVSIAPLRFGSGMKVKVLDAMARGLPVVTTSVGAEGIVSDTEVMKIANEPALMAEQISILLSNKSSWENLRDNARELVRTTYNWDFVIDSLHKSIADKLNERLAGIAASADPDFVCGTCNLV